MKKLVIAPDSYKGSLSAIQICDIIAEVARSFFPDLDIVKLPIADGGEGFVDALLYANPGERIRVQVKDPLMRDINAYYGILPNGTAVIEMAAASGLPLLQDNERNVLETSSFGTGQLIRDALQHGCRNFILGLGGSATNDGGAGAANALGIRFLAHHDQEILAGKDLISLTHIDPGGMVEGLKESHFILASDVTNPLYGPDGAAAVFAPQKGASSHQVALLDEGLRELASVVLFQKGLDLQAVQGSGTAGGLAVPFLAFTQATIKSGVDVVLDAVSFEEHLKDCDLVITGEGRTDYQSSMGKVLAGVGRRAKAMDVPVIAISGALEEGYEQLTDFGIKAFFSTISSITSLENAMAHAENNLRKTTHNIFALIKLSCTV
jgi:glycerate kinase